MRQSHVVADSKHLGLPLKVYDKLFILRKKILYPSVSTVWHMVYSITIASRVP